MKMMRILIMLIYPDVVIVITTFAITSELTSVVVAQVVADVVRGSFRGGKINQCHTE
jgi:hypothetical protein